MVKNPTVLGSCEHFYCRQCIRDYLIGENCPKCLVPSHAKDVMPNRKLNVCVTLVKQLQVLLGESTKINGLSKQSSQKEASLTSSPPNMLKHKLITTTEETGAGAKTFKKTNEKKNDTKEQMSKKSSPKSKAKRGRKPVQIKAKKIQSDSEDIVKQKVLRQDANVSGEQEKEKFTAGIDELIVSAEDIPIPETAEPNDPDAELNEQKPEQYADTNEQSAVGRKTKQGTRSKNRSRNLKQESTSGDKSNLNSTSMKQNQEDIESKVNADNSRSVISTPVSSKSKVTPQRTPKVSIENQPWLSPTSVTTPGSRRSSRGFSPGVSPASSRLPCSPLLGKKNHKGETPLHQACIKGQVSLVESLLDQGAQVNVKDNAGWTPLHEASNHGHVKIVELLLTHGASINIPGMDNMTPLHDAVENNRVTCVKLLISRGADVNARNIHGKTPLDFVQTKAMKAAFKTSVLEEFSDRSNSQKSLSSQIHQVVIVATGLNREQKIQLQKGAALMHGKVVQEFCNEVTHVVTSVNQEGQCPRTMKFLKAVMSGKWILTFDWVTTCLEYKSRVSEEPFEVPGSSMSPNSMAPSKARCNVDQQLPGLFDGCNIFFSGDFNYPTPEKNELIELVKLGGATITAREPKLELINRNEITVPYHSKPDTVFSNCSYFIVYDSNLDVGFQVVEGLICKVKASWIMDCIAKFELIVPN